MDPFREPADSSTGRASEPAGSSVCATLRNPAGSSLNDWHRELAGSRLGKSGGTMDQELVQLFRDHQLPEIAEALAELGVIRVEVFLGWIGDTLGARLDSLHAGWGEDPGGHPDGFCGAAGTGACFAANGGNRAPGDHGGL